ncbi:hypothetical protein K505DRAFT_332672 [Melanomma pulvis-pyrius CBS 109.77]|uniref:Uncharacterized protein n=1 Tax=Melanomma pulvis-pyrius CBS 109.77 TaxID=1314802 RepID=A0A6A6XUT8_9PLEO|nr:hypothetical protein K505DRAFT_332672 [Melanomma pulvis-pyrius CBS 109.77]
MLLKSITALALLLSPLASSFPLSAPVSISAAASGKNIYLITCLPRVKEDETPNTTPFTAISYFKQPITNSTDPESDKAPRGDQNVIVSSPAAAWEGVKWSVKAWRNKVFTAEIGIGAENQEKGSLAGSAKLDTVDYVCFKDGTTAVRYKDDDLRGNCKADYWCASLDTGKDKGGD